MTPRSTDWGLALLVGLLFATGVMTLFAGHRGDAWIFAVHGAAGFALAAVLGWKLRRVWRRLAEPARWDRRTAAGAAAVTVVAATLLSGVGWSSGAQLSAGGYNLLNWHFALGVVLTIAAPGVGLVRSARCAASLHRLLRGRLVRRQRLSLDLLGRGQPPATERSVVSAGAWRLGRPSAAPAAGRPSGRRPARSDAGLHRWLLLAAALERRAPRTPPRPGRPAARRQPRARDLPHRLPLEFELQDAFGLLLATGVGGEALAHEHGAPVRLVAPGRRGFEWVKWVVCVELHDGPDPGALASTVWSSFTPEGRGAA